ncbi:MAG: CocE/NonD family hydrolase [Spirulinaceae cyanobacterium]
METRDGVRLDADVYYPQEKGDYPVLLMRQPYGRVIASTVVYNHPSWYAAQGYLVVIQDVRGRGTSQGKFDLFAKEIEDGYDSVVWASQLPGSTRDVGMYGFSYQGMTQLYAAIAEPSPLKTICPAMVAGDLYADWAYEGRAFCLHTNLAWAIQLAAETTRLQGDEEAFNRLHSASRHLPFYDPQPSRPHILTELAPDSFYHQWLDIPPQDSYWQKLSPQGLIERVDLPMLHIGGWFDTYLRGTLRLYHHMAKGNKPQHLIIGPWGHLPWGRKVGAKDYGASAISPIDEMQIRWFDYFLKGKDTGIKQEKPVHLFAMGSNQWRYYTEFPNHQKQIYYLVSNGLASVREDAGRLCKLPDPNSLSSDTIVSDPWRAVPSLGGHSSFPSGSFERGSIDSRSDVLTYTSDPLQEDLQIIGTVVVEIYCFADAPSFDVCAILSEVQEDGEVYNFCQGYRRVDAEKLPIKIPLQTTSMVITKGKALRLSLSATCFPAYPINPGTGKPPGKTNLIESRVITLNVSSNEDSVCRLLLPKATAVNGDGETL